MAISPEAPVLPRRRQRPVGHRLLNPIYLPITQLFYNTRYKLREIGLGSHPGINAYTHKVLDAALHHYFVDAEARRWDAVWEELEPLVVVGFDRDLQENLVEALHRMIRDTTGPLMPSFQYRYEIDNDTLVMIPSLPTIEDYEQRIRDMADPDEGWIPPRFRR